MSEPSKPILHTYFRSSCSARVRTACHWKKIPVAYEYIHLVKNEQFSPEYSSINPMMTVPTLRIPASYPGNLHQHDIIIRQSIAILEFLEESPIFAGTPKLLPTDPVERAKVRELVGIIAMDVQPPSNQHILKRISAMGGDSKAWAVDIMTRGLVAYEKLLSEYSGMYSVGDEITMADVCLAPAVEGALRWGVALSELPNVSRVYEKIRKLEAFEAGDWRHQADTPAEFINK